MYDGLSGAQDDLHWLSGLSLMNREVIGHLIGLRYKLMWAKTRSRNGRIALFVIGYLLFVLIAALMAAGGIGAGIAAVKSGHAGTVAKAALSGIYMSAVLWTLLLGFGMNAVFSDTELRRYPLTAAERRLVKFSIGIADPFWALVLVCDFGVLVGIYVFGAGSFGIGALAVLLLLASDYVLAQTLGMLVDRLAETKVGSSLLLLAIMALSMLPSLLAPQLRHNPALQDRILAVLRFTPPFAAADAITAQGAGQWYGLLLTALWLAAFVAAMIWVEKNPFRGRAAQAKAVGWDSRYERLGALFGPANAAMVGFWLRFYSRNNRVRTLYFLGLPLAAFLTYSLGRRGAYGDFFRAALGAMPVLSYMGTSRIAVNQFGYTGGGFRRFFLLPTASGSALRAASYASVIMGGGMIPLGLIAWIAFAPGGRDAREVFMLACSSLTGLLVFNGLGLWSTLYGPRKGNYASAVGNDLSLAGNIVLLGCLFSGLLLPGVLEKLAPALIAPDNWPLAAIPVGLSYAFYRLSLTVAAPLVYRRREMLMKVVEGKT
jgi:hypothetical protein